MRAPEVVRHWGSTAAERAEPFPCDELLPDPDDVLFRAVDVDAPPELVFRWLAQLRVAPYSYDWIDNRGRRSPQTLTPGLDEVAVGQRAMRIFRIVAVEPGRSITFRTDSLTLGEVVVTYRVTARAGVGSRLVVKLHVRRAPGWRGALLRPFLPTGDLVMMRRQLRNLKQLAEQSPPG